MKNSVFAILILALLTLTISDISAQYGKRNNKYGNRNCYYNNGPVYDLNTETTIIGTVESYELLRGNGYRGGLVLKLKTNNEVIDVHVGPTWNLDNIKLDINKGDKLEIFGSKVTIDKDTFIIASKVKLNGTEYQLRDKYGYPKWAGNRRNRN
ncbi:MAG TPA: hypothetical protein PL041_05240 [Melioribacteraceae bacterium]|nr:hypothetical protein [Melioribacteraceae bacterium]